MSECLGLILTEGRRPAKGAAGGTLRAEASGILVEAQHHWVRGCPYPRNERGPGPGPRETYMAD